MITSDLKEGPSYLEVILEITFLFGNSECNNSNVVVHLRCSEDNNGASRYLWPGAESEGSQTMYLYLYYFTASIMGTIFNHCPSLFSYQSSPNFGKSIIYIPVRRKDWAKILHFIDARGRHNQLIIN